MTCESLSRVRQTGGQMFDIDPSDFGADFLKTRLIRADSGQLLVLRKSCEVLS